MALFTGRQIRLEWEKGHQFHGLEVVCRPLTTGDLIDIWTWTQDRARESQAEIAMRRAELLARVIKSWNYAEDEDSEEPAPISQSGIMALDHAMVVAITEGLANAAGGVSDPLEDSSEPGATPEDLGLSDLTEYPENPGN